MIIIPDIHGRTFWKDAVKERKPKEKVVFLGDYLDPYPNERKQWGEIWENFEEIIEYKKKHPRTTVLLLGNHDIHYFYNYGSGARYDYFHSRQIGEKFQENREFFQLAHEEKINGKRFIFTHAGIHKSWIDDWFGDAVTDRNVVKYLNNLYTIDDTSLERALDQYSAYRGGFESYGSMVWADMREWSTGKSDYGDVQVFGHTQLVSDPINFNDTLYDLDVRRAFRIDDKGNVCEMDGSIIKKTEHGK